LKNTSGNQVSALQACFLTDRITLGRQHEKVSCSNRSATYALFGYSE